ncbi:hypothetical protein OPV22_027409 [Ensete ventricosum]|uniref:Neprosin domain-containing protein n=1 Tax=Ensete ventricosum TaxID=4639 RepID=A0AAV8PVK8_ENSVE|nr:hypothetical protein OPV22_027409 [Ensete ventricosum]
MSSDTQSDAETKKSLILIENGLDSGKATSCFNLLCSGFMQITPDRISLTMQQESWKYGDLRVGYWPRSLFSKPGEVASQAWFGGDVHGPSCPRLKDYYNSNEDAYPTPNAIFISQRGSCNGENYAVVSGEEPLFYSGGPGRNRFCE